MARIARVFAAAAIAFLATGADLLTAGEPRLTFVPWKVLDVGERVDAPLVLYWIPASAEELRRSELLTSYELTLFASRCVAMRVVRFNDSDRLTQLDVGADVPMAVLADGEGNVVGRVEAERGSLQPFEVEELVRAELDELESQADAMLDAAREYASDDEPAAAMAIYEKVWAGRCVWPRQARDAKKAMKRLSRK